MEWFIPYNVASSKNSKQIIWNKQLGRRMVVSSSTTQRYIKNTRWHYKRFGSEFRELIEERSLEYPIRVSFTFIRDSKRQFDYINAAQVVQDLMVKNKWIPDDSMKYLIPVFEEYQINKDDPGVVIKLL